MKPAYKSQYGKAGSNAGSRVAKSVFLMILLLTMVLTACSRQKEAAENDAAQNETMTIKPSEFSEETQDVLKIMDDEISFFDYSVDETIKSMRIDIWAYEDGKWTGAGNSYGNLKGSTGRIAVRINDATYDIFDIDESGYAKTSCESIVDFEKSKTKTMSSLSHPTKIEPGKEISLWVKLGFDTLEAVSPGTAGNFREADYDSGLAVTITFSTESVE